MKGYTILEVWGYFCASLKHDFAFTHQIQYNPIQEFHYLPKAILQLNSQYLLNSNQWRQQL